MAGRPRAEFDKKQFTDLIALGCEEDEICWFFRDETGKPANRDTLSRWCKRTYDLNFQEYRKQNSLMALKIQLRKNQLELSKKSASMAIWLGKQYLNQKDRQEIAVASEGSLNDLIDGLREPVNDIYSEAESVDGVMEAE